MYYYSRRSLQNTHRKSKAEIFSFSSCYKSLRGKKLENTLGHIGRRSQPRKQGPFTVPWSWLKGLTPWLNRGLGWEQGHKSGTHQTGEALTALTIPFPVHNNQQHKLSKVVIPGRGWSGSSQHSQDSPISDLGFCSHKFYLGHHTAWKDIPVLQLL